MYFDSINQSQATDETTCDSNYLSIIVEDSYNAIAYAPYTNESESLALHCAILISFLRPLFSAKAIMDNFKAILATNPTNPNFVFVGLNTATELENIADDPDYDFLLGSWNA